MARTRTLEASGSASTNGTGEPAGSDSEVSAGWKVPKPHDAIPVHLADGGLILLCRHGNRDGPRLVLSHGSGFAADAYLPFWSLLLPRFDIVLYDLRNHGRNPLGDLAGHHIPMMVWDNLRVVREIDRHFGAKPKIGVFHSVSAAVAVFQAVEEACFDGLVLFDPPVCPPGLPAARQESIRGMGPRMAERARVRQEYFERWEDLAEGFHRSKAFARVEPGAVELLARSTSRPRIGGDGFELCCPPEYEARLFEQLYKWAIAVDLSTLEIPLKVIGGDPVMPFSFLPTIDPELVTRVDYDFVPETTHLLQLEEPQACASLMIEFLSSEGLV